MKYLTWYILLAVSFIYVVVVSVFPFAGPIALSIHFVRIAASVAGWIIFMRLMPTLFHEVPSPRRDYLIASINFFLTSLLHFSFLNEANRLFGVDNNVFTGYLAGAGSMYAITACVLALIAADTDGPKPKYIAVGIACVVAVALVFVAPQFRLGR